MADLKNEMQSKKRMHFPKADFLKKFLLAEGLPLYNKQRIKERAGNAESGQLTPDISLESPSADLMNIFSCDKKWPVCLFDFTLKQKMPNFFVFKVQPRLDSLIRENHFDKDAKCEVIDYKPGTELETNPDKLLLERNGHLCNRTENFCKNFKSLFVQGSPVLLEDPRLNLVFDFEKDMEQAKEDFIKAISDFKIPAEQQYSKMVV